MSTYDSLVKKLKEIFQIDQADLDFGIYRILRSRSDEIVRYLETDLKAKVEESLSQAELGDATEIQASLEEAVKGALALGADPECLPKIQALKKQLADTQKGAEGYANEVFAHLETFFGRYYDKGDFISRRRYKGDTYAIPYDGEEVVLYWANKDQYYTKSAEQFTNYAFPLSDGRRVHIKLVSAETSKDNQKDSDKEHCFVLATDHVEVEIDEEGEENRTSVPVLLEKDGELVIHFRYEIQPKGTKQSYLNEQAAAFIKKEPLVIQNWTELFSPAPTEENSSRALFDKQLADFTAKNTSDYFIHKNLKGFLSRELDFYIKNEVMHLDDIQDVKVFRSIEHRLRMIQVLREIALDLVSFLAQIEDFQKKLWLKKKFVVRADYCITLDRIPREFYATIAKNSGQAEEWRRLGFLDSAKVTEKTLEENQYMVVDTKFFPVTFKYKLLSEMENIDAQTDGLLIHSENFQALNLLQAKYKEQVKCVYIDPPYNIGKDDFPYKDSFQHSSWAAMMYDRTSLAKQLQSETGIFAQYIDENEHIVASQIISFVYNQDNRSGDIVWKNSSKNDQDYISMQHEYLLTAVKDKTKNLGNWTELKEGLDEIYAAFDGFKKKYGNDWKAIHSAALEWYNQFPESNPITDSKHYSWMDERGVYFPADISGPKYGQYRYNVIHPVTGKVCKEPSSGWRYPETTMKQRIKDNLVHFGDTELTIPNNKTYLKNTENQSLTSVKYRDGRVASKLLLAQFGKKVFKNPKDVDLGIRFIKSFETEKTNILDYFAGSGTTGHAVINLNREDGGDRKYILVDMGEHFNTVLKPRIEKVVYSAEWKDGKPQKKESGVSHCFKYFNMESYEDTLNNLSLMRTDEQRDLLRDMTKDAQQDYLLHYMLDMESRNILSVEHFKKPFDYIMNIAIDTSGAAKPMNIDLVETFNYLIGLKVERVEAELERGFLCITGENLAGEKIFILWRDCDKVGYDEVLRITEERELRPGDSKYDILYINGDTTVPNYLITDDGGSRSLKVRLIENEFLHAMFDVQDVL